MRMCAANDDPPEKTPGPAFQKKKREESFQRKSSPSRTPVTKRPLYPGDELLVPLSVVSPHCFMDLQTR